MEFIIFLSRLDRDILDLLIKANYIVEENKIECLLNKEIKGLHNFKENKIIICTENAKRKTNYRNKKKHPNKDNFKTELAIRKALRHEATHAIQKCNNNKIVGDIKTLENCISILIDNPSSGSSNTKEIDDLFKDLNSDAIKFQELYYLERQHINFLDKQRCGNFLAS